MKLPPLRPDVARPLELGLPGFLPGRRWFGAKGRVVAGVVTEDLLPLRAGGERGPWLAVVRLAYADGGVERYALLLRLDDGGAGLPAIARLGDDGPWLVEAAEEPASMLALLVAMASSHAPASAGGTRLEGGDLYAGPRGRLEPLALEAGDVRPLRAEQSNTSIRLPGHVFKLFRRLEDGENPELEIGRFLTTRTGFHAMGAIRGSLTLVRRGGTRSTLGVVQDWIENTGDGWKWALDVLAAAAAGDASAAANAEAEIVRLGETTAAFHLAVASATDDPAFSPVPLTAAETAAWTSERNERAGQVLAQLRESLGSLAATDRAIAEQVLAEAPRVVSSGAPAPTGFHRVRVHGDYHLGQTLRGHDGWVLVDFEGEPARTLARRREKHCALKDVAGMLRSFDYAAEAVRRGGGGASVEAVASGWRRAFLSGYLATATPGSAVFLPSTPEAVRAWIGFFELDKAFYELEYEIHSRPDWVGIPLRGIRRATDPGREAA